MCFNGRLVFSWDKSQKSSIRSRKPGEVCKAIFTVIISISCQILLIAAAVDSITRPAVEATHLAARIHLNTGTNSLQALMFKCMDERLAAVYQSHHDLALVVTHEQLQLMKQVSDHQQITLHDLVAGT